MSQNLFFVLFGRFTFEERFTVKDLIELCDEYEIEYSTDNWF